MNFNSFWNEFTAWLEMHWAQIVIIVIGTVIALVITRLVTRRIVSIYKRRDTDREHQKRAETLGAIFNYVLTTVVLAVAVMLLLDIFGLQLGPLLAAAGVVGIAVGFGAQHLVQDFTNGFFMMLDNEVRIGDVIEAGGKLGTVEQFGLRQVVLRDIAGNVHFIPNSKIDIVTNMTMAYSYCLMDIGVAYRENVDEVGDIIRSVDEDLRRDEEYGPLISEPVEIMGLDQFADSALMIKIRIKVQPGRQWKIKRAFYARLKKAFDAAGIEIPFPHMTLYMGQDKQGQAPPLRVVGIDGRVGEGSV